MADLKRMRLPELIMMLGSTAPRGKGAPSSDGGTRDATPADIHRFFG